MMPSLVRISQQWRGWFCCRFLFFQLDQHAAAEPNDYKYQSCNAIETALLDWWARHRSEPLWKLIGVSRYCSIRKGRVQLLAIEWSINCLATAQGSSLRLVGHSTRLDWTTLTRWSSPAKQVWAVTHVYGPAVRS
jgi:hypothetical protein